MRFLVIKKKNDTFELLDNFKEYAKEYASETDSFEGIYLITFQEKEIETPFESKTTIYLKDGKFHRNTTWGSMDRENISDKEISKEEASRLIWINRKHINALSLYRP